MKTMWFVLGALLIAGANSLAVSAQDDSTAKPTTQEKAKPDAAADAPQESDQPAQEEAAEDYSALSQDQALEKVKELAKQFNDSLDEYRKKFKEASAEEKVKLRSEMPKAETYIEKFQKLAELHPQSAVEGQALLWIVQHQRSGPLYDQSLEILVDRHADLTGLKPIVMALQYQPPSAKATDFFAKLRHSNTERELRAVATYAFLQYQKRAAELKAKMSEGAENVDAAIAFAKRYEETYGKEQLEFVQQMATLSDEETLGELEKLVAEYGDVVLSGERTLASTIEGDIFELKFLQIGKEVPDIEGEDIDGTEFKLSDYRGKVVVIDFWGDW